MRLGKGGTDVSSSTEDNVQNHEEHTNLQSKVAKEKDMSSKVSRSQNDTLSSDFDIPCGQICKDSSKRYLHEKQTNYSDDVSLFSSDKSK